MVGSRYCSRGALIDRVVNSSMAKKQKSKQHANAGGANPPAVRRGDFPHDAFNAALRRYAHPAAVVDLDRLAHGGPAWRRYLEAFGQSCLDLSLMISQQSILQQTNILPSNPLDMNCLLVHAFSKWKGRRCLSALEGHDVYNTLINYLPTYGRPLPTKVSLLWEHQARVVQMYGDLDKRRDTDGYVMRTTSNNIRKEVGLHTSNIDWVNLTPIYIKDLVLYNSHNGKYVEGKLLVEPFTPKVGTTTILEDANGDVILMALYNFLPDGLYGRDAIPVASTKLPVGATVRIAGPFLKIFQDGSRGIRIDNPNDISVVSSSNCGAALMDEDRVLLNAKDTGNALVKKKMYNAGSEAYIAGIRKASVVPTLLSNRSQAYAMMNDWERSLADAAASLTMRPDNEKTWARYNKALEILIEQRQGNRRNILTSLLHLENDNQATESEVSGKNAAALKDAGNIAFKNKQYDRAAEFYTSALMTHGEISRALLANWALCCIRTSANLDAISSALASLRIRLEAKAVTRLANGLMCIGEIELCQLVLASVMSKVIKGSDVVKEQHELMDSVDFSVEHIIRCEGGGSLSGGSHFLPLITPQKHLPTWIGPIESFHAGANKGRGIRATKDIQAGQVLLIEPPLAMSETDGTKECLFTIDSSIKDHSQVYLRQAIILRSQRECVLSRIVDSLSDGVNQRGVTSLYDLIPNLSSCKLLLPTHYEYMQEEAKLELSADRVDAIVDVNCFGEAKDGNSFVKNNMGIVSTRLVPATSLFNHSKHPSCSWNWNGGCSVIFALKDVKKGEELTIRYHADDEAIQRHWGIHE